MKVSTTPRWTGWRKASASGPNGNCVQVRVDLPAKVGIQDSKNPGPMLLVDRAAWRSFLQQLKADELS